MQGEYKVYYCQYVCDGIDNLCDPYASNGNFPKKDPKPFYSVFFKLCALLCAGGHDLSGGVHHQTVGLCAMTFPAIFSATGTLPSACAGTVMAVGLAYFDQGLLKVAVGASAAVFLVQLFGL